MYENNEIMESVRNACGYGEDYEHVRLWETGMDELQQEDWEAYMGGPEDREFEARNALHEDDWERIEREEEPHEEYTESLEDNAEISINAVAGRPTDFSVDCPF